MGQIVKTQEAFLTVRDLLNKMAPELQTALPKHMRSERLIRVALTALRRTPKLLECSQQSLLGSLMVCAQLGLEPDGVLGGAYLVPFNNRKTNTVECQAIIGYRGMIDLSRRTGELSSINAYVVHARDKFKYRLGLDPMIDHEPVMDDEDPGEAKYVYAVAKLKDGGTQFVVMTRSEVMAIKARSRASDSGPWVTDPEEMWKKTAIRRLWKTLPSSPEMRDAVDHEERDADVVSINTPETFTPVAAEAEVAGGGAKLDAIVPPKPAAVEGEPEKRKPGRPKKVVDTTAVPAQPAAQEPGLSLDDPAPAPQEEPAAQQDAAPEQPAAPKPQELTPEEKAKRQAELKDKWKELSKRIHPKDTDFRTKLYARFDIKPGTTDIPMETVEKMMTHLEAVAKELGV